MRYLLDTCVVSDFAQGEPAVLARINVPEDLAVSALTAMEVAYGLLPSLKLARRLKSVMDAFFRTIRVLPYDPKAAEKTAAARSSLKRRGRPSGAYDVLIAGPASAHELILVTSNVREFKQVEGLRVEDWRSESGATGSP